MTLFAGDALNGDDELRRYFHRGIQGHVEPVLVGAGMSALAAGIIMLGLGTRPAPAEGSVALTVGPGSLTATGRF